MEGDTAEGQYNTANSSPTTAVNDNHQVVIKVETENEVEDDLTVKNASSLVQFQMHNQESKVNDFPRRSEFSDEQNHLPALSFNPFNQLFSANSFGNIQNFFGIQRSNIQKFGFESAPPVAQVASSFNCQQCDSSLETFEKFIEHMRTTHLNTASGITELNCSVCNRTFNNFESRLAHLLDHFVSVQNFYQCQHCSDRRSFGKLQQLKEHFVATHGRMFYRCDICLETFAEAEALTDHAIKHSIRNVSVRCAACALAFRSNEQFIAHVQLVHANTQTSLNNKEKVVKQQRKVGEKSIGKGNSPKRSIDSTGVPVTCFSNRGLKCIVCDEKCADEFALDEHRLLNHCKVHKSDRCAVCHVSFGDYAEFVQHCHLHTSAFNEMSCVICRQSIRGDIQVKMHGDYHLLPDKSGETTCDICKKSIPLEQHADHLLEHPPDIDYEGSDQTKDMTSPAPNSPKFHVCECGQRFENEDQLREHFSVEHLDLAQNTEQSELTKNGNGTAQRHSSSLYGLRSFRCDKCSQSFSSMGQLIVHKRKHSMDQKNGNMKCPICDKKFPKYFQLISHMKVHEDK